MLSRETCEALRDKHPEQFPPRVLRMRSVLAWHCLLVRDRPEEPDRETWVAREHQTDCAVHWGAHIVWCPALSDVLEMALRAADLSDDNATFGLEFVAGPRVWLFQAGLYSKHPSTRGDTPEEAIAAWLLARKESRK